jgi:hypothetical protein
MTDLPVFAREKDARSSRGMMNGEEAILPATEKDAPVEPGHDERGGGCLARD